MLTRTLRIAVVGLSLICFTLFPGQGFAHSPGLSVSLGSNPIRTTAGIIDLGSTAVASAIIGAPADQDLVLTDLVLGISTENDDARISGLLSLQGSDGTDYGVYVLQIGRIYDGGGAGGSREYVGTTGIRIPAGVSVSLIWTTAYSSHGALRHSIAYTLAGYLAKP
jgi:hypothetical protein